MVVGHSVSARRDTSASAVVGASNLDSYARDLAPTHMLDEEAVEQRRDLCYAQ